MPDSLSRQTEKNVSGSRQSAGLKTGDRSLSGFREQEQDTEPRWQLHHVDDQGGDGRNVAGLQTQG